MKKPGKYQSPITVSAFVLNALVKPFFSLAFLIGFGGVFVFVGNQTIVVESTKHSDGNIIFDYVHEHFWGTMKFNHRMEQVKEVELSSRVDRTRGLKSLVTLKLVSDTQKKPLLPDENNFDTIKKRNMMAVINSYIENPKERSFSQVFKFRNAFYWVGLPFLVVGMLGLLRWPKIIMDQFKSHQQTPPTKNPPLQG